MQLPDIKDLGKVIDLCRKKGVEEITIGEITLKLGPEPEPRVRQRASQNEEQSDYDPADPWANFPAGELSPDQLAFYSAGGTPGQEPWLNKGDQ